MARISDNEVQLDGIDKLILKRLMTDARSPVNSIAKEVGISGTAVHQRLKKLEKSKLIAGSQVLIDPKVLGYKTLAFIGIYLDQALRNQEAVRQLKKVPEVIECHYTTGNWSVLVKILCRDNEHLMQVLNTKVQTIEGISRTETYISLDQQIQRQIQL
ncbi:MAG: AsnC family transcriptional regulator [Flavobacteriales bacterium]|jgi:Lrp/AsnC family transcriptional regulator for asnA, asnC and gidA|nr:AsnC family transcriptional regulator [Flavobacteriales bacterium]MBT7655313.1 AsnC family transcriptional regulator [Flavobacteriales bacterium]MDG1272688.1 Lrp/AsnC ligand binding domain-containing protein [Flavobacteriaceae bacterium]